MINFLCPLSAFVAFLWYDSSIGRSRIKESYFMTDPLALAIDQGTHATRSMLVDMGGRIRFSSFADIRIHRKGKLRVEQDPEEILASVRSTLLDALAHSAGLGDIVCAGLAVQRSSVLAWDRRSGAALTPVSA
jgi:glycerol kinase